MTINLWMCGTVLQSFSLSHLFHCVARNLYENRLFRSDEDVTSRQLLNVMLSFIDDVTPGWSARIYYADLADA